MSGNFWLLSGNFSLYKKLISCIYQMHQSFLIAKHFRHVSGNIQHVSGSSDLHKNWAIFYPMKHKFPDCSKFPAWVRKFTVCIWKISDWYKLVECVQKFPACVRELWSYKNISLVFYHMTQQTSRLPKVSGVCPEVLSMS